MLKSNNPALHHLLWHMEKNAAVCSWYIHHKSLSVRGKIFQLFHNLLTEWHSLIQKTPVVCINNASVVMLLKFLLQLHISYPHNIKKKFFTGVRLSALQILGK